MTILSWVAGFQLRTGWRFLSAEESAQLSEAIRAPDGRRLRAIARHGEHGNLACLDVTERDVRKARVLILGREGERNTCVEGEHPSLAAWVRAMGLTSEQGASGGHGTT